MTEAQFPPPLALRAHPHPPSFEYSQLSTRQLDGSVTFHTFTSIPASYKLVYVQSRATPGYNPSSTISSPGRRAFVPCVGMGELRPRGRGRKPSAAMRVLRGARDLYVRGLRGLDRLLAAASPRRAGVGRPTSRVFGVGNGHSDEDLRELVRAMEARHVAAASVGSGSKEDAARGAPAPPVKRRGATPLERISEDAAFVHPTR